MGSQNVRGSAAMPNFDGLCVMTPLAKKQRAKVWGLIAAYLVEMMGIVYAVNGCSEALPTHRQRKIPARAGPRAHTP